MDAEDNIPLANAEPIFALTPATYHNRVIDYSTKAGIEIWNKSIEKLQDPLFDVEAEGIHTFLQALSDRAFSYGWTSILEVPEDLYDEQSEMIDLTTHYGELSLTHIRTWVDTYIQGDSRAAQDSHALYTCLMNSLSTTGRNKVTLFKNEYTMARRPSGVLLLKVIIRECRIDTRATVRHIRAKLSTLPSYLASIKFDVPQFNRYVLQLINQLSARGAVTQDLLANLFVAYETAPDKDFVNFIKQRKQAYDMGTDISEQELMQFAQIQYQIQVEDGTWQRPSPDQQRLIALETKFEEYKKRYPPTTANGSNKNNSTKGRGNNKKGKDKPKDKSKQSNDKWKTVAPLDKDKNKPKKLDGKTYWWCPHHSKWCLHKVKDCFIANNANNNEDSVPETRAANTSRSPSLRLTSALTRIRDDENDA